MNFNNRFISHIINLISRSSSSLDYCHQYFTIDKILDRMINSWSVFIRLLLQTSPSRFFLYDKIILSRTSLIDIRSVIEYGRLVDERILCIKFRFHERSDRTQWDLNFDDVVVKTFCRRFISLLRNVISLFFHIFFEDGPNWITILILSDTYFERYISLSCFRNVNIPQDPSSSHFETRDFTHHSSKIHLSSRKVIYVISTASHISDL